MYKIIAKLLFAISIISLMAGFLGLVKLNDEKITFIFVFLAISVIIEFINSIPKIK